MNQQNPTGANPWADIVGPYYTPASLARALGWTEAKVNEAADSLALLRLTTSDGVECYPAFQVQDGEPLNGLADVLRVLRSGVDAPWTWAQWLNTPLTDEDGVVQPANIERLRAGQLTEVLLEARHDAATWRG
jgi:hypothetical protein